MNILNKEPLDANKHYSFQTLMTYDKQDIIEYAHKMEEKCYELEVLLDEQFKRNEIKNG